MNVSVLTQASSAHATDERAFTAIYEEWFDEVRRWLLAFGTPSSEAEDLAQEVFLVVRRKLEKFDGRNLLGWLYKISQQTASDHRRRAWFRNIFSRPRDVVVEEIVDLRRSPAEILEGKQANETVWRLIKDMSPKKRTAFVLFELEGYSGEEIAALEGAPIATIFSRIHHAHKEFLQRLDALKREEGI